MRPSCWCGCAWRWSSVTATWSSCGWTKLSLWRLSSGEYLSWAYILGQSSLGYLVEHAYSLERLDIGTSYTLRIKIANAYVPRGGAVANPAITLQPVVPFRPPAFVSLENRGYADGNEYVFQTAEISFVANSTTATIIAHATGDLVLQSIELLATGEDIGASGFSDAGG
jgi:hypothetical protein